MKIKWDFRELTKFADNLNNTSRLDLELKRATKEIAHELLRRMKKHTPIGDTWMLRNGWDTNSLIVIKKATGFEVLLVNPTIYATWVNDGHRQKPGRFIPGYFANGRFYYDPSAEGGMKLKAPFVEGRFFVEKGIAELQYSNVLESIIMQHLRKWWDSI